jgi:hypothetical protein
MMKLTLCDACARLRGARTSHAERYEETCLGVWRGRCDDCGAAGASGAEHGRNLAIFVLRDSLSVSRVG